MKFTLLLLSLLAAVAPLQGQRRELMLRHWQFSRDNAHFSEVTVPHDWAISGPFDKQADMQTVAIVQNGETEKSEITGRTGALPWTGKGYYRCTLPLKALPQRALLCFDGAMSEPHVFVNGVEAGWWAYGYNAFRLDVTRLLQRGDNLIEVHLENRPESSRWYPGAGIYRPVTLLLTSATAIDDWKSFVRTESLQGGVATVDVLTKLTERPKEQLSLVSRVRDEEGKVVFTTRMDNVTSDSLFTQFRFTNPRLWSPETPYLYTLERQLLSSGRVVDTQVQRFGIRTVSVSRDKGFQLNGVSRKFKGVCLHHDLGPLGVALNKAALIRQIKLLKEMGCDAIRTSHNMPSQMQMDICDSLGMMVMAESFDMWKYPKCKNGYARFFDDWWYLDIQNLILANRNHPSIIMWSIGNEIPEQGSAEGKKLSEQLQQACHSLDSTRYVTQGLDHAEASIESGVAKLMDVPGFNYRVHKYDNNIKQLPQGFLLGSETASTVSSRGVYKFPVVPDDNSRFASWAPGYDPHALEKADGQCSSYDLEYSPWSNLPDDDWVWQDDKDWVIGEFVWTGYDYLGEPSPYDEYWPSRSSYFGICDLAGLPKDRYYLYRSHWNKEAHTIHLLPHWSWGISKKEKGNRIGEVTPVYCYTDYPTGELFVNGKSQGKITKNPKERLDRYRLRWNNVKYEPGEIKVVVYDAQGNKAGEQTMKTASKPAKIQLDTWTANESFKADGDDLAFITVSLTDAEGTLIPQADDQLTFEVTGAGSFEAVCNGDATSLESFKAPTMKLFNGQLVVVVRSAKTAGTLTLKVTDETRHLSATTTIKVI